jgi:hypothetical protein
MNATYFVLSGIGTQFAKYDLSHLNDHSCLIVLHSEADNSLSISQLLYAQSLFSTLTVKCITVCE